MSTITKIVLKNGKARYKAEVSVNKVRDSARFDTRLEAKRWANEREIELSDSPNKIVKGKTTTDVFERYAREITPTKRGAKWEQIRLRNLTESVLADIPLERLGSHHLEAYRAELEARGLAPNSVIRELAIAKTAIRQATHKSWSWLKRYPWHGVEMPEPGDARDVLITPFEVQRIVVFGKIDEEGVVTTYTQQVAIAFLLAIETAMRLGELTKADRADIDLDSKVWYIPKENAKTSKSRSVPLSPKAIELIKRLPERLDGKLFGVSSSTASVLFRRIKENARIKRNITFHDTRHLALTRMSEIFDLMELCRISGHANPKQLMTYYNKSVSDMAEKFEPA